MQNWSKHTKQYFIIGAGVLVLAIAAISTLYLYNQHGFPLPEVLYVVDEKGEAHGPHSPLSRAAIRNLRAAGLDTMKKDYPALVLLNNRKTADSGEPLLLMSNNIKDLPKLIEQGN